MTHAETPLYLECLKALFPFFGTVLYPLGVLSGLKAEECVLQRTYIICTLAISPPPLQLISQHIHSYQT